MSAGYLRRENWVVTVHGWIPPRNMPRWLDDAPMTYAQKRTVSNLHESYGVCTWKVIARDVWARCDDGDWAVVDYDGTVTWMTND